MFEGDCAVENFDLFQKKLQELVMPAGFSFYPGGMCFAQGTGLSVPRSDFISVSNYLLLSCFLLYIDLLSLNFINFYHFEGVSPVLESLFSSFTWL